MATCRPIIIADGHHRYETALTYRDAMRRQHPDAPANAAFNYVLTTMVSMDDPGLVILPTHRLIHSYTAMSPRDLLAALGTVFEVEAAEDLNAVSDALAEASPDHPRYGFYDGAYAVLTLKDLAVMDDLLPDRDPHFRSLDVTVLHEWVIEHTMGLSKESVQRRENITYLRDPIAGLEAVDRGEADLLFLLRPTRMEQIRACTSAEARMPQKSTDFFPKIISGMVALPLDGAL